MSILKIIPLSQVFITNEVAAINKFGGIEDCHKLIEKYQKLSKTGKLSKSQKLFKSQKSTTSKKVLSKSENFSNFNVKENGPSFLTLDARTAFNHLWLAFIKVLILQSFDLKYYI